MLNNNKIIIKNSLVTNIKLCDILFKELKSIFINIILFLKKWNFLNKIPYNILDYNIHNLSLVNWLINYIFK